MMGSDSDELLPNMSDYPEESVVRLVPGWDRKESIAVAGYAAGYAGGTNPDGPEGLTTWHQNRRDLKVSDDDYQFFEEETSPFEVKIPLNVAHEYSETCCFRIFKSKAVVYRETKAIRAYRRSLQKDYQKIIRCVDWLQLPGREHAKAKGHNYLAYQLWILTYAAIGLPNDTLKKLEKTIVQNLEDSLILTEAMGVTALKYLDPLKTFIERTHTLLEQMVTIVDSQMAAPEITNTIPEIEEARQKSIFVGNRVRHFAKLRLYTREPSTKLWGKFTDASEQEQVSLIGSGLNQFVSKLKVVKKGLDCPLIKLREALNVRCEVFSRLSRSFIPHINKMHKHLQKAVLHDMTASDTDILKCFLSEVITHIQYIAETGQYIVTKIKELVFFTRLCYRYLIIVCEVPAQTYESLIEKNFPGETNLLPFDDFETIDYFYVAAPDVLRKVPVLFNVKHEWALHYDGHHNSTPIASTRQSFTYAPSIRMRQSLHSALSHSSVVKQIDRRFRRKTRVSGEEEHGDLKPKPKK